MIPEPSTCDDIFECTQCGDCCMGYGGTYITEEDVSRIAEFVGKSPEQFINDCCQISDGGMPVIAVGDEGRCIFFKENCSIHPVKPRMCRAWPFIDAVAKAPSNWGLMSDACPGIQTGASHEAIRRIVMAEMDKLDASRNEKGSISPHLRGAKDKA